MSVHNSFIIATLSHVDDDLEGWWWCTCWLFAFFIQNYYHEPLLFVTCVGTAVVVVDVHYYFSWHVDDSIIDDVDGIPSKFICLPIFLSPRINLMYLIIARIIIWCIFCIFNCCYRCWWCCAVIWRFWCRDWRRHYWNLWCLGRRVGNFTSIQLLMMIACATAIM